MKKLLYILLLIFYSSTFAQVAPGTGACVASLDFDDSNTFLAPDCGSINASQWTVTNDSCTLSTVAIPIVLSVLDSVDITVCNRVNPSGNLEADDKCYLKYTVDAVEVIWDTIPGDRFTNVTVLCTEVTVKVGALMSAQVTYVNNHQSEDWRLQDGGVELCYTIPINLPIQLLDFTASMNNGVANIDWSTASESSNNYFMIEKSSDGVFFVELDRIDGAGNSSSIIDYSIVDKTPYKGLSYYRLTQVDYDGNFSVHNIIGLNNKEATNYGEYVEVVPNPAGSNEDIEIRFDFNNNQKILCSLIDAYGVEVYSFMVFSESNNRFVINTSNLTLTPGVYLVRGSTEQSLFSKKIVVQ